MPGLTATVFHATDADPFDAFDPDFQKAWKFGFWFSPDREFTTVFGGNVCEARITLHHPMTISYDRWNLIRERHARDHDWFSRWRRQLEGQGRDGLRVLEQTFKSTRGVEFKDPEVMAVFDPNAIEIIGWTPRHISTMEP